MTPAWHVRGSYFEACNCDAICPCRSVHHGPTGPSTYGVCTGTLSWHVLDGRFGEIDLSDRKVVMLVRYHDEVEPSSPWEVILYVDERADEPQFNALADIYLNRAGGTVAKQYGPAIGTVHSVQRARITVEHLAPRKRIDIVGHLLVEAEQPASDEGDVQCGIPGFDHPGTELFGEVLQSSDAPLEWDIVGKRNASFASDFHYRSEV